MYTQSMTDPPAVTTLSNSAPPGRLPETGASRLLVQGVPEQGANGQSAIALIPVVGIPTNNEQSTPAWVTVLSTCSWPVVALVGLIALRTPIMMFLRRVRQWRLGDHEFNLDVESVHLLSTEVRQALATYREQSNADIARRVRSGGLQSILAATVTDVLSALPRLVDTASDLRATLHVQDPLLRDSLYQLLDYNSEPRGRGRSWSVRFGIIGRVWRREQSEIRSEVPTDANALIEEWGMTQTEARKAGRDRQSFACVFLRNQKTNVPIGILYFDATNRNAFGATDEGRAEFLRVALKVACERGLVDETVKLIEQISGLQAQLELHDDYSAR